VAEERYARGGVVHGPGEGVPVKVDLSNEYLMTAAQASARAREVLQAVNDAGREIGLYLSGKLIRVAEQSNCHNCHQPIRIMINRGTGWCSEQCRKALADE